MAIDRRGVLLLTGGVVAASGFGGYESHRTARASSSAGAAAGPPIVPNTGIIASHAVPSTLWTHKADNAIRGLRYVDGRAYVITLSSLTALDARTGRQLWRIPLFSVDAALGDTFADGFLYISGDLGTTGAGGVMAIDCATGRTAWTYTPPAGVALNGVSGPLDGAVYVTVYDDDARQRQVWAIDAATRRVRWKSPCADQQQSVYTYAPAGGSRVFNCDSEGGAMTVFDAASGAVVWQTEDECCFGEQGPVGRTLIASGADGVSGLDAASGARVWSTARSALGSSPGALGLGPVQVFADGGDAYYVWDGARVAAYRAGARGTELWSAVFEPGGFAESVSVTFDGEDTMFIGGGVLFAVDTRTGGCRWQYPGPSGRSDADMLDAPLAAGGDGYCFTTPVGIPGTTVVALAVEDTEGPVSGV